MEEAKKLASVVDRVVIIYIACTSHMMLAGISPGNAWACPGLQPPMTERCVVHYFMCFPCNSCHVMVALCSDYHQHQCMITSVYQYGAAV